MEPQSLICARIYSDIPDTEPDPGLFKERVSDALNLRKRFFDKPFYRLIYGDSDGLSGVVVDRYGDILVVQLNTAGIERHGAPLLAALEDVLQPAGILLRCDSRARREQGLEERLEIVSGEVPEWVRLEENGVAFEAPVQSGQKTGWFYDHRYNRSRLQTWSAGRRVLDVYSYIGGWGVQAAAAGAAEVLCVDNSAAALEGAERNAALNGLQARVKTRQGKADQVMGELRDSGERFDVVVLDPPAFIQRRRDHAKGCKAYRRINELALQLLQPGGMLVSASCSMHLSETDLVEVLRGAANRQRGDLRIVETGTQAADHPLHPAIAETRYLKALFSVFSPAD
jgi:23S rRNA (cytosine1962-C5)-methyltransferase